MDRLIVEGIRVRGRHGALPGEQERAQPFLVDVEIEIDAAVAAGTDRLEDTVDVRAVVARVRESVTGSSLNLVETLAERIAAALVGLEGAAAVTVRVHKPGAGRGDPAEHPYAVEVRRPKGTL